MSNKNSKYSLRPATIDRDSNSSEGSDMNPRNAITEREGRNLTQSEIDAATTEDFLGNREMLHDEGDTPQYRKKKIHDDRIIRLLESSEAITPEDTENLTTGEAFAFINYRQLQKKIQEIETIHIPELGKIILNDEEILNDAAVDPSVKKDVRERLLDKTNSLLQTNINLEKDKIRLEELKNDILNKFVRCVKEEGSGGGCSISGGRRRKTRKSFNKKSYKKHYKKHNKKSYKKHNKKHYKKHNKKSMKHNKNNKNSKKY